MLLGNERGGGGACLSTAGDLVIWNDALTSGTSRRVRHREASGTGNAEQRQEARATRAACMFDTTTAGQVVASRRRRGRVQIDAGPLSGAGPFHRRPVQCGRSFGRRDEFARRVFDLFVADKGLRRAEPAAAARERRRSDAARREQQGGAVLQRAHRRAAAPDRQQRQAARRRRRPLVAVTKDRFRNAARLLDVHVAGRVRIDTSCRRTSSS